MEVTFLGLEVTIPDDPVTFIKAKAIELLNHLGYEWPTSNEDMLDQWAELWEELPARVDVQLAQFEQAITHVTNNNAGPTKGGQATGRSARHPTATPPRHACRRARG